MKKRLLATLLAVVLMLGLLPAALAVDETEGANGSAEGSAGLRVRYADYDESSDKWKEDTQAELMSSLTGEAARNTYLLTVYYMDGNGKETRLSADQLKTLTVTGDAVSLTVEGDFLCLEYAKVGEGKINYTVNDTTYSIPVMVTLPSVGFYSSATRSADTYLGSALSYTDGSNVFYILPENGWKITGLECGFDMEFFDAEILENGAVEVTLSEGFTSMYYQIELTIDSENGGERTEQLSFTVTDKRPGLRVRHTDYDSDNEEWVENTQNELMSSLTRAAGGRDYLTVYYLDGDGKETRLRADQLITLTFTGDAVSLTVEGDFLCLEYAQVGEGTINYIVEGTTYSVPITVTLPSVGFYSSTTRGVDTYLGDLLSGDSGEEVTAYLLWDSSMGELSSYTVMLNGTEVATEELASDYNITITEETYGLKLTAVAGERRYLRFVLIFTSGECDIQLTVCNSDAAKLSGWSDYNRTQTVTYHGTEYTFGLGMWNDSAGSFEILAEGWSFGTFGESADSICVARLHLGAVTDIGTSNETLASADILDGISDVEFFVKEWINVFASDDSSSALTVSEAQKNAGMYMTEVTAESGQCGYALIQVNFTVTLGEGDSQVTQNCTVYAVGQRLIVPVIEVVIDDEIDTAEELNEILRDDNSFLAYMEQETPEEYSTYRDTVSLGTDYTLEIHLPAVTYDDVITVGLTGCNNLWFYGTETEDGKTTTLPGLRVAEESMSSWFGVTFDGTAGKTQTYGDNGKTCGVLAVNDSTSSSVRADVQLHRCTVKNFDYGVLCAGRGYAYIGGDNVIENCGVGWMIACKDKQGGCMNSSISDTIFKNCGTAIKITGLPDIIVPYRFRVYQCDFVGNEVDFDIRAEGNFYFYRNFYGTIGDEATDVTPYAPKINVIEGAAVYANPHYAFPLMAFEDTSDYNFYLYLDVDRNTRIINSQSDALAVDCGKLEEALEETENEVAVEVVDDKENTLGYWTFNETEE